MSTRLKFIAFYLTVSFVNVRAGAQPSATPRYTVTFDRYVDSGAIGELAIDSASDLLYGVGKKVIRIDGGAVVVVDSLPTSYGHGYAFADELSRGISRRGVLFDLKTGARLREGADHSSPTVAYDAMTHRAAVNFDTLSILDVAGGRLVGSMPLGTSTYVVSDGRGTFFLGLASDTIAVIDARTATVVHRWALGPCNIPAGMTVDRTTQRLFISCENDHLIVVNTASGRIVATLPTRVAHQLAFDRANRFLFVPTEHDTLVIVKQEASDKYVVVDNVMVGPILSAVAVDPITHSVFLVHFGRAVHDSSAINLMVLTLQDRETLKRADSH